MDGQMDSWMDNEKAEVSLLPVMLNIKFDYGDKCSSSTTMVSPEPFPHRTRSLRCL